MFQQSKHHDFADQGIGNRFIEWKSQVAVGSVVNRFVVPDSRFRRLPRIKADMIFESSKIK
jgi:hypothetical protein